MSRNYVSKNDELRRGDYLISNNGQWKAVFERSDPVMQYPIIFFLQDVLSAKRAESGLVSSGEGVGSFTLHQTKLTNLSYFNENLHALLENRHQKSLNCQQSKNQKVFSSMNEADKSSKSSH
ncbi:hypothetical protein D9C73_021700 [Collichthys lucidus]|uniref:Uncharacterized protein n=1 Tax=Collichthys lucidus TaxID=240159 RepID=A0A4U5VHH6_COLLU|nr:hypothetical protein D9C73_021700 [Collichthys lucidus]